MDGIGERGVDFLCGGIVNRIKDDDSGLWGTGQAKNSDSSVSFICSVTSVTVSTRRSAKSAASNFELESLILCDLCAFAPLREPT